jgi:hypothetical protein
MKYAKMYNGKPVPFFGVLVKDGKFKRNPSEEEILSAGYLPMEEQEEPQSKDGFIKSSKWVQTDTAIIKKWTVLPDRRPMSQTAVNKMLIAQQINTLEVDDNTALRMKHFYPTFDEIVGQKVKQGFKFRHGDYLWATVKELTIQSHYAPGDGMESLYTKVNETHAGTLEDPIPYDGNMVLENGKHYSQYSTIYKCNWDTVNPVYHKLSELVGQFVVEV